MGERQQVILCVPPLPGFLAERLPGVVRCGLELLTDAATAHWRRRWTLRPDVMGRDVAIVGAEADLALSRVHWLAELLEPSGADLSRVVVVEAGS